MRPVQLLFWWIATVSLLCRHAIAAPPTPGLDPQIEQEARDMQYIGYEVQAGARRVFVRTNEPVRYTVDRSRANTVVLVLGNTGVSRSVNTHRLATKFMPGPVKSVQAHVVENPSASVRVEVVLKHPAAFRVEQQDTELALVFD